MAQACEEIEPDYKPTITFVVVRKRHNTRVFTQDKRFQDRSGNVVPGTVIDSGIAHPTMHDFFLMSHAGIQGTSRPCHYSVLYDDNKFSANVLQQLTYHLAYNFCRCTRSVSMCAPGTSARWGVHL